MTLLLIVLLAADPPPLTNDSGLPGWAENQITYGPMLGRVTDSSVAVWARTLRPGTFHVHYGTSADALDQTSDPVETTADRDFTGVVTLSGLNADTEYHYELGVTGTYGRTGRRGRFRTLPSSDDLKDPTYNPRGLFNFSFEIGSCANQIPKYGLGPELPLYRTMIDEGVHRDCHFAIMNGDWLYEIRRDFTPEQWAAANSVTSVPPVLTHSPPIAGVWENYKWFLFQGRSLAEWHANVPSYFTYDDHELLNDVWGTAATGLRDRRAVFRDPGVKAWDAYLGWANEDDRVHKTHLGRATLEQGSDVLIDRSADFKRLPWDDLTNLHVHWNTADAGVNDNALDGVGGDPNAGVYEVREVLGANSLKLDRPAVADSADVGYSIGRKAYWKKRVANTDIYVLDCRGMRGMHDTSDRGMPNLSMLGESQYAWLVSSMQSSDADFAFVVSSVPFTIPHVGGEAIRGGDKDEAWTTFLDERERLIRFWDTLDTRVFVMTGDLHNSFAIRVSDNVHEFACGPHNSNNHHVGDEGGRPPNGPFDSYGREVDILWSTWFPEDISRRDLKHTTYTVVTVNNVLDAPQTYRRVDAADGHRPVAFPRPQVIVRYFDGRTGKLRFATSVQAKR